MADNKKGAELAPNKSLLIAGIALLVAGIGWMVWEGVLRPETEVERRDRVEEERIQKEIDKKNKKP